MKKYLFSLLLAGFVAGFIGCGGSSDGDTGQSAINAQQKARNAFAVADATFELTDLMEDLDYTTLLPGARSREFTEIRSGEVNCTVSGKMHYSVQVDTDKNPPPRRIAFDFDKCKTGIVTRDGHIGYEVVADGDEVNSLSMQLESFVSEEGDEKSTYNLSINSEHKSFDKEEITLNGEVVNEKGGLKQTLNIEQFIVMVDGIAGNYTITVNGTVTLSSDPAGCADGQYVVETIEPIVIGADEEPVGGKVKINGVEYELQPNGKIKAVMDGEMVEFDSEDLDINCTVSE